jgi:lysyl-tRNA synthetase class 2
VVERLIVDTAQWARERGAREMSLNFAGMRRVIESANPAARTLAVTLHALDRWIEIAPLYRFTRKFRPQWRPRHLLLRSWLQLAVVAAVALRAEFGKAGAAPAEPVAEAAPVLRARPH